jgi:hypothetical protein
MRSQLRLQERNGVDSAGDGPDGRPPEPPPEVPPEPEQTATFPWDAMNTHAEIDGWADVQCVARGADWSSMNLATKRAWLVTYFDGARPWEAAQE